jgi:hypothetical protein
MFPKRLIVLAAAVLATGVTALPTAQAGSVAPQLRPGLSDFGLYVDPLRGVRRIHDETLRLGLSDFGPAKHRPVVPSPWAPAATSTPAHVTRAEPAQAFNWTDAGVGAGAAGGAALLFAGLAVMAVKARNSGRLKQA